MRYQLRNKNYNEETPELALYSLLEERGIIGPQNGSKKEV